jgi:hypothetical protein
VTAIKFVLVLLLVTLLIWAFRNRRRVGMRAGARIGVVVLIAVAIGSVLDPGITTAVARHLGVGRGADLVLYLLVIAFAFTSAGLYFRSRDLDRRLEMIIRQVAIREAVLTEGPPEVGTGSVELNDSSCSRDDNLANRI